MTRTTNERIAGFTFLAYVALGIHARLFDEFAECLSYAAAQPSAWHGRVLGNPHLLDSFAHDPRRHAPQILNYGRF